MRKIIMGLVALFVVASAVNSRAGDVTWSGSIKGLVEARCVGCHGAEAAPEYQAFKKEKEKWLAKGQGMRMDTYSHLLLDAVLGAYTTGELSYARQLMAKVPDHSLTIFDRAFLLDWQQAGQERHWLMRAKTPLRFEVVRTLGPGDYWIRMPVSPQARQQRPDLPNHWEARLIETGSGQGVRRYLTSLADVRHYPAQDLAEHYRQRWEIELGYREIKQSVLAGQPVLRSKQPELVRQELWGVLIAYNLLRQEMRQIADTLDVPPQRLSFHWLALAIVGLLRSSPLETPGSFPQRLAHLCQDARCYVLPPRRNRSYPRQIKPPPQNHYPKKKMPVS